MSTCIYCQTTLDDTSALGEDKKSSLEHIVPYSLGGSNGLATRNACKGCNSTLGVTVDAAFINQPVIGMLRHEFETYGYSGEVPDIVIPTRSVDTGEPGRMIISLGKEITFKHEPVVIRDAKADREEIMVAGQRPDVKRIIGGIVRKAQSRYKYATPVTEADIDLALDNAVAEVSDLYQSDINPDVLAIQTGLVKIAFGFAHLALGRAWTCSLGAEPMRKAARGQASVAELDALLQGMHIGFRQTLPLSPATQQNHHVVVLLAMQQPVIFVSLFGNELLTTCVKLDASFNMVADGLAASDKVMVSVDPRTRKSTWVGLKAWTAHMLQRAKPCVTHHTP